MYLLTYLLKLSKTDRVINRDSIYSLYRISVINSKDSTREKVISNITFTSIFGRAVEMRKNKN